MKFNKLFFIFILSFFYKGALSQIVGGSHPTQSLPTEVKTGEVTKGGFDSDVSLFTGAMSSSYDLGSVKTLSGLSFNLRLSYSGSKVVGNTVPIATGIPYGEGWNLNLPTISIQVNAYQNYTQSQQIAALNSYQGIGSPVNMAFTKNQASTEGALKFLAPQITIPGVLSERFVLKNYDPTIGEAIFVPSKFEKLVEARLRGSVWYVTLENGDTYKFMDVMMNYRNPNDIKLNPDSIKNNALAFKNSVIPKGEVLTWYCSSIYNRNHSQHQQINFIYNGFGLFDFYKEFQQPKMSPFYAGEIAQTGMAKFEVLRDIMLISVSSSSDFGDIEKIELNYKTFKPTGSVNLLKVGDADVFRKDSLYNFQPVYNAGWDTTRQRLLNTLGNAAVPSSFNGNASSGFSSWRKYAHVFATQPSPAPLNGRDANFASSSNPYLFSNPGGNPFYKFNYASGNELPFSHSFLETPQLNLYNIGYVPGDLYEIKTLIHNTNNDTSEAAFLACNYDISIVSGKGNENSSSGKLYEADYQTGARSFPIYNTFSNPVKWTSFGKNNDNSPGFTTPDPSYITTSNLFTMPQLPTNNNGIFFQVGPANSDHEVDLQLELVGNGMPYRPNTFHNSAYRAYSYYFYNNNASSSLTDKYKTTNPYIRPAANFGLGLPWFMMTSVFGKRYGVGIDTTFHGYSNPINRMWFATSTSGWANNPTAANSNVKLSAMQLIRYSKNTYMLTNVKKYVSNGYPLYDKNNGYVLLDSITLNYQNVIDTLYDVNQFTPFNSFVYVPHDTVLNCASYGPSSTNGFTKIGTKNFKKNGYQNVVLLTSITKNATNPSTRNASFNPALTPPLITYFEYGKVKTDSLFFNDPYGVMQGQFTGHFHNLNKITDHLGGITEYTYYNINSVNADWKNLYAFNNYKAENATFYPVAHAVAYCATPMVKEKIVHNSANDSIPTKVWQYIYDPCKYVVNKTATLPANYLKEKNDSEFGYKTTKVKYPKLTVNETKSAYDVYTHYTSESNNMFMGKVKTVQSYDANGLLLKKHEYTYKADTAYLNYYYTRKTFNYIDDIAQTKIFSRKDYQAAGYVTPSTFPSLFLSFYDVDMKFLELAKPQHFGDSCGITKYLNSYFVKLIKETSTDYDYKIIKKKNGPSAGPSYGTPGDPPSTGQRQIASNSNMVPLETSGYRSVQDFVLGGADNLISITPWVADSISTTSEFTYWDANPWGKTTCLGFKLLREENSVSYRDTLQYEPSWQLYKKKSYSNEHPGAYTTEEHFYYYDLIQTMNKNFGQYLTVPDSLHGLFLCQKYRIRNIPYQTRTVLKNNNKPAVMNSLYFWYDAAIKREQCNLTVDTIYINKTPCSIWSNQLDSVTATNADTVVTHNGCYPPGRGCIYQSGVPVGGRMNVPAGGGNDPGTGDPHEGWQEHITICDGWEVHWLCPPPPGDLSNLRQVAYCGEKDILKLKNIYKQSDTIYSNTDIYNFILTTNPNSIESSYTNDYTLHDFKEKIARFKYYHFFIPSLSIVQQHQNVYMFALPYKTYTPLTNHNFNEMGLVTKTEDQRGLIKEMQYDAAKAIVVKNRACPPWSWLTFNSLAHKYGQPNFIKIYDKNDPFFNLLTYSYKFNADLSIDSIKDNNNKRLKYTYDAFARLKTTMVNGDTTSFMDYSYWNGSNSSFETRASQNYVETSLFSDKGSPVVETSRAYEDPLGRKFDVAIYTDPNFYNSSISDTIMIHSGTTSYDNWDRSVKQYKPFIYRNPTPNTYVTFSPRFNSGVYSQQVFEPNQRGNVTRSSKYGEDINTGHKVLSNYNIVNGQDMTQDLGTSYFMAQMSGSSSQNVWKQYRFTKTAVMDEDGKKVVTYTDALGKKVAVKSYIDATNNAVTQYIYGSHFKPIEIRNPSDQRSIYSYDYNGNVVYSTSVDADTVKYSSITPWGDIGQSQTAAQKKFLPSAVHTEYTYDAFGRIINQSVKDNSTSKDVIEHFIGVEWPTNARTFNTKVQNYFTIPSHSLTNVGGRVSMSLRNDAVTIYFNGSGYSYNPPYSANFYSYNSKGQIDREVVALTNPNFDFLSIIKYKYNLRNSITQEELDVNGDTIPDKIINYEYDAYNRLVRVLVNNTVTATYSYYDEKGLVKKLSHYGNVQTGSPPHTSIGQANLNDIYYNYDVRDRLISISSSLYKESLYYDNNHPQINGNAADTAFLVSASANYNGNINAISHNYYEACFGYSPSSIMDSTTFYGYQYDGINRLTKADASVKKILGNPSVYTPARQCGDETYTFDKIGNIVTSRIGVFSTIAQTSYTTLYNYHYNSGKNQLQYISNGSTHVHDYWYDIGGTQRTAKTAGHYQRSTQFMPTGNVLPYVEYSQDGSFDSNGDTVNYGIAHWYNARDERIGTLEFPTANGYDKNYYLYNYSGRLVASLFQVSGQNYVNTPSQYDIHIHGISPIGFQNGNSNHYYLHDHLGSVRVKYTNNLTAGSCFNYLNIEESFDYTPYGRVMRHYQAVIPNFVYAYQGSLKKDFYGPDSYLTHFRGLNADIGRWKQVDPIVSHNESPYASMRNNPILFNDPDGDWPPSSFPGLLNFTKIMESIKYNSPAYRLIVTAAASACFPKSQLAQNMVQHFAYGKGKLFTLTEGQMIQLNSRHIGIVRGTDFHRIQNEEKTFNELLASLKPGESKWITRAISSIAFTGGTLANFTVLFNGTLTKTEDGKWKFKGTMKFTDVWNLDPKSGNAKKTSNRSEPGELQTRVGEYFIPGVPFPVSSVSVPVNQTSDDTSVDWFDGKSQSPTPSSQFKKFDSEAKKNDKN